MEQLQYTLIRSSRKMLAVQIRPDGTVVVRAPMRMRESEIRRFLDEKADWIRVHLASVRAAGAAGSQAPLSAEDIRSLAQQARRELPGRVSSYAARMGVTYGRITVRNQTTRWGSCSSKGNLNFNCLLMLAPEPVRDYVVVHELAHRKQMNHSAAFWAEVAAVLPDYVDRRRWLKENGPALMARMRLGTVET